MTIRNPEEYFPSYLRYIFEKTLTWPIFKKEEGNRSPCAAKLIEKYICLCVAGADIVADKKLKDKTERLQYKRHARRVRARTSGSRPTLPTKITLLIISYLLFYNSRINSVNNRAIRSPAFLPCF